MQGMKGLLDWVGNILFFLVFITVVENLLPGKSYGRYVRLSAGMVLILLVMKPVTGGLHLEDQISRWFETFTFQQETQDLSKEILGVERQRLAKVIDSYEQVAAEDINIMAAEMGVTPVYTRVTIERDEESENYGAVVYIQMEVEGNGENRILQEKGETDKGAVQAVNPVSPVESVVVDMREQGGIDGQTGAGKSADAGQKLGDGDKVGVEKGSGDGMEAGSGLGTRADMEEGSKSGTDPDGGTDPAKSYQYDQLEQLRRKVELYYGLETGKVEIKFKGR